MWLKKVHNSQNHAELEHEGYERQTFKDEEQFKYLINRWDKIR